MQNLEYGAYAPNAPSVFIDDTLLPALWASTERYYVVTQVSGKEHLAQIVGRASLFELAASGGKLLLTNQPLSARNLPNDARADEFASGAWFSLDAEQRSPERARAIDADYERDR